MAPEQAADQAEPDAFGILGPLEVLRSGRVVPLAGPRQRAVLAVLLLQPNRVVSVDRLVEDVWEGTPRRPRSPACRRMYSTSPRAQE
jgi:DNA-binding response OmpR family regulator